MLHDGQCAPRGSSESAEAVSLAPRQLVHSRSHFMVKRPARVPARQASMAARCGTFRSSASFLGLRWARSVAMPPSTRSASGLAEPVAVGAAIDLGRQGRGALARALGQRRAAPGRTRSCARPWRRRRLRGCASRPRRPPAWPAARRTAGRSGSAARTPARSSPCCRPCRRRFEIEDRAEAAERALGEFAGLAEMPAFDPLVGLLLPFEVKPAALPLPRRRTVPLGCGVSSST